MAYREAAAGYCGEPIDGFVVAVELAAAGVAGWAAVSADSTDIWITCFLGWMLLTMAWIDFRTMLLPDLLTVPLLIVGLGYAAVVDPGTLTDRLIAAAVGYLLLYTTAYVYRKIRGRDGLGLGDAKLLAALGAWLGLGNLPIVLFLAACLGLLAAAAAAALGGRRMTATTAIPFGPCLALSGWLLWLYGDSLIDWLNRFNRI